MLDWYEYEGDDQSPVATLVQGLPVDDGELAVVVEPLLAGGAPEPGLLARLRGREDEVGAVGLAIIRKYQVGTMGDPHYLVELHFGDDGERFTRRVVVPDWVEIDDDESTRALLAAPLTISAPQLVEFVASALRTLSGPLAGGTWRVVEVDGHRAAEIAG